MEGNGLGLDFALFDIDFVAAEDDGDVFAHADEVTCEMVGWFGWEIGEEMLTMPVGDVLVSNARCNIEHDDAALAVDIIAISQPTELLLSCCVPDIKLDLAEVLLVVRSC